MGWKAIYKNGTVEREEDQIGRPVQAGIDGQLKIIAQEDSFGHNIAIDLINGVICLDYGQLDVKEDGEIEILSIERAVTNEEEQEIEGKKVLVRTITKEIYAPKYFWILHGETNIVGELVHWKKKLSNKKDPKTKRVLRDDTGKAIKVQTDFLTPLTWRPIWFTRMTNGIPAHVIGAQTTLPDTQGGKNVKKMFTLFVDGRVGID